MRFGTFSYADLRPGVHTADFQGKQLRWHSFSSERVALGLRALMRFKGSLYAFSLPFNC